MVSNRPAPGSPEKRLLVVHFGFGRGNRKDEKSDFTTEFTENTENFKTAFSFIMIYSVPTVSSVVKTPLIEVNMINRILIFGYFGCGNLGDETNLGQLIAWTREINPRCQITVISADPGQTALEYQVAAVGKYNLPGIIQAVKAADRMIGGGGNLFQDLSSLRSLVYYSALVWLAGIYRVRVFLYGQGIGPIRSTLSKLIAKRSLSRIQLITIRDRISQLILEQMELRQPQVFLAADPLLARKPLATDEAKRYWNHYSGNQTKKVGLIIRRHRFWDEGLWNRLLGSLPLGNIELYILAIQDDDLHLVLKLVRSLGVKSLPVPRNWRILQQAIGGFDMVISCRLHGLIAAVIQNIPCVGLAADLKIAAFCLEHGINYLSLDEKTNPALFYHMITTQLRQPVLKTRPARLPLSHWQSQALENRVILGKVLRGEL